MNRVKILEKKKKSLLLLKIPGKTERMLKAITKLMNHDECEDLFEDVKIDGKRIYHKVNNERRA